MTDNIEVNPKCPYCEEQLEYRYKISIDFDDIYCFINWYVLCPHCQRAFVIAEDYKMVERRFVE